MKIWQRSVQYILRYLVFKETIEKRKKITTAEHNPLECVAGRAEQVIKSIIKRKDKDILTGTQTEEQGTDSVNKSYQERN